MLESWSDKFVKKILRNTIWYLRCLNSSLFLYHLFFEYEQEKKEKSITPFFHSLLTSYEGWKKYRTWETKGLERERKRKYLNGVNEKVPKEEILVGFPWDSAGDVDVGCSEWKWNGMRGGNVCLREGRLRLEGRRTEKEGEREGTEGVEHKNRKVTRTSRRKNLV